MNTEKEKKYESISVTADVRERMLSVVDSDYMRKYLSDDCNFNIYNWVELIGSAPRPMDLKLELMRGLRDADMAPEAHSYLDKAIDTGESAMNRLYMMDPGKSVILVTYYDSDSPDPYAMGDTRPFGSYKEVLKDLEENFADEDGKFEDRSDRDSYYALLTLYDVIDESYKEQITYYCAPDGKIHFIRFEHDPGRGGSHDFEKAGLEEIFAGSRGMESWMTPCQAGDILYVDMRPWYRPTYCLVCWLCPGWEFDCCGIQCLYPTVNGLIGEAALKHGEFLPHFLTGPYDRIRPFFSPLYRAELYEGELPKEYAFMQPLSERLKADPELSKKIDDLYMSSERNKVSMNVVYRPVSVAEPVWKNDDSDIEIVWRPDRKEREWWEDSGSVEGVTIQQLSDCVGM